MADKIDVRGMSVHQSLPFILENLKNRESHPITTLADSLGQARQIQEMACLRGIDSYLEESNGEYLIHLNQTALQERDKSSSPRICVVVVTGCTLGRGEQALGKTLMRSYFYHLKQCRSCPKTVIFLNSGVALTVAGSEILDDLRILAEKGVEILSSDTCLEFYGLKSSLVVGRTAGMKEIIEIMHRGENTLIL
jgi:selenium metabolism protein YedF